jgi:hypothetical protein
MMSIADMGALSHVRQHVQAVLGIDWGSTHHGAQLSFPPEKEDRMKRLVPLVIAAFLACSVSPVLATNQKIRKRQYKEQVRINRGVKSGQLTGKERTRLQNQSNLINVERTQALSDGKMTQRERTDIRHDQNRLNKDIRHKKHNQRRVYQ